MNIDIERLINLVIDENECYTDYILSGKTLYTGDFKDLNKRKEHLSYTERWNYSAQNATSAVMEVLNMDSNQRKRTYIMARVIRRWYIRTNYEFRISDIMESQIQKFIFS